MSAEDAEAGPPAADAVRARRVVETALSAAGAGRHRSAIDSLRAALAADPASPELRLGLAELYRFLGSPDQAGRWGALEPGWATPYEERRFADMLRADQPDEARFRSLLLLPDDAVVPQRFASLVAGRPEGTPGLRRVSLFLARCARVLRWCASAAIVIGLVGVFLVALGDGPAPAYARSAAATALALLGGSFTVSFVRSLVRRGRVSALVLLVAAALSLSGAAWLGGMPVDG